MKAIVVVDENWGIGRQGKLLIHLPGDLKYFKEKTLGKTVIMGRETLEGNLGGRPLRDRETIVLSRDPGYDASCRVCHSLEGLMRALEGRNQEEIYVAGGEKVYNQLLPFCDTFLVTKIYDQFEADRVFPNLDEHPEQYEIVWSSGVERYDDTRYQFFEYVRKKP